MRGPATGKRVRGGALMLVAGLLILSAAIRIALDAGPAIAREASLLGQAESETGLTPEPPALSATEYDEMLRAFQAREAALRTREAAVEEQMQALDVANRAIDGRLSELVTAEENLRATVALADGAAERDLSGLTTVYEKMKPKDTAALFEEMAPEFAAGFLARMRPEAAAGVMAGLSPTAAYSISVILAGRNTGVPTE
jgi:flagellar motility protein MotE (MotC chaperone)